MQMVNEKRQLLALRTITLAPPVAIVPFSQNRYCGNTKGIAHAPAPKGERTGSRAVSCWSEQ